jgi:hypothetical protein
MDRVAWLLLSVAAGGAAYFIVLFALGLRPASLGIRPH